MHNYNWKLIFISILCNIEQAPVVQKLDNAIYPQDKSLSSG